jgi:methyl-accepting chemotaxis protein
MFATLRKLKIKTKVLVGFGIVLTLLVVVSVSSLVSFRITEWTLGNFLSQSDLNDMASSAQLDVQTLRRAASVYTYTANPEALKEARASLASLKTHIDDMIQTAPKPEYVTALNAALEDLAKYGEGIEKLYEIKTTAADIQTSVLDPAGQAMHNSASAFTARSLADKDYQAGTIGGQLLERALLCRIYVSEMIARQDWSKIEAGRRELELLHVAADRLDLTTLPPERAQLVEQLKKDGKRFVDGANRMAELVESGETLLNGDLTQSAASLAKNIAEVSKGIAAETQGLADKTVKVTRVALSVVLIAAGTAILSGLLIAWLLGRIISTPIVRMTRVMERLANREWSTEVPSLNRKDEIGAMAQAVQVFKQNGQDNERLQAEAEENRRKRKEEMQILATSFEEAVGSVVNGLASAATEMNALAEQMATAVSETNNRSSAVAAASEQASANIQTVASATEELSSSVQEIARNIQETASGTQEVSTNIHGVTEAASKTEHATGQVLHAAGDLSRQSEMLRAEVVKFIEKVRAA